LFRLRQKISAEYFDYTLLMEALSTYKSPRAKVTNLLKSEEIIRIRKGLYVFGPEYRKSLVSLEVLANQIYGPSYVSLEYALAFYGLIPEFVNEITSVTTKRNKQYHTPLGSFSYAVMPISIFSLGYTWLEMDGNAFLIATPEKAIADLFYHRNFKIDSTNELEDLLFCDLRLEENAVEKFHLRILTDVLKAGGSPVLSILIDWIRSRK